MSADPTFRALADHELAGVTTALLALATALKDDPSLTPAERQHYIQRQYVQAQRAAALVHDLALLRLLDQAAPPTGSKPATDLAALLRDGLEHARGATTLSWQVQIHPGPLRVVGEARVLTRAIEHLMSNAARHTPADGWVRALLREADGGGLLEIGNSGPPIPAASIESLFQPFVRLDKVASRSAGGNGLGLTVVRAAAKRYGGRAELHSGDSGGNTATLWLPLA